MLRAELDRHESVVLREAPEETAFGWLGRAHEVTVSYASDQPPVTAPVRRASAVVGRDSGRLPGADRWAYLKLYGHDDRVPELLTAHLPRLLGEWGDDAPSWWFTRYNDPDSHLRLRLHLTSPHAFGDTAQGVAAWAAELRGEGLIKRVQWDTDEPETGRYGTGPALQAAERFFSADSAAVLAQMTLDLPDTHRPAVTAASFVDITSAFLGSTQVGRDWLTTTFPQANGGPVARDVVTAALRLCSPDGHQTALRDLTGGDRVATAWTGRRHTLAAYRQALEASGTDPAAVLPSLLHLHHNRAAGIAPDAEATCRRLARAAALSWTRRTQGAPR